MTQPPVVSPEQAARHELIARLHEMSEALESADDALFTERLHALLRRRDAVFYQRIARITEELQSAFESLESDQRWNSIVSELPDAGARLDHVSQLTEKAAHHTLDLVEAGQRELKHMAASLAQLAAGDVAAALPKLQAHHQFLRGTLSELAQSQEYQDLSGQILRRVTGVVREVEAALLKLLDGRYTGQAGQSAASKPLAGPTVPGVGHSASAAAQDDADALLAMFDL